jgi:antitoxin component of MazEF toxin-antitoxin module
MIQQYVRKSGNSYVVTIPKEEMERLNIHEGQLVAIDVTPLEVQPVLRPELKRAMEETREDIMPALRYLAER